MSRSATIQKSMRMLPLGLAQSSWSVKMTSRSASRCVRTLGNGCSLSTPYISAASRQFCVTPRPSKSRIILPFERRGLPPAQSYSPPRLPKAPNYRPPSNISPPRPLPEHSGTGMLYSIVGLNLSVYLLWQVPDPQLHWTLTRHFMLSPASIADGRYHTLLTSAFSHLHPLHLAGNMAMLLVCGGPLPAALGSLSFLSMYLTGALVSSCAWVVQQRSSISRSASWQQQLATFNVKCIGASGAVNAVLIAASLFDPLRKLYLFALIPVPVSLLCACFVLQDVVGVFSSSTSSQIAHIGHLGGALVGAVWLGLMYTSPRASRGARRAWRSWPPQR